MDASLHDAPNLEEGGFESGRPDTAYLSHNGHLTELSLSRSANGNEQPDLPGNQLLKGKSSSSDCKYESTISMEFSDEESNITPAFVDKYDIWEPPGAENEDDNREHDEAILADYDDECADGNGTQEAKAMEEGVSSGYHCKKEQQEAMEEVMNGKFKKLVSRLLMGDGADSNDYEGGSWIDIVTTLAWKAALFVMPDSFRSNAMDPVAYVKVKCVASGSRKESQLVKGLVFKKNAAHRHMVRKYENPRLLLIRGMLGPGSSCSSSFSSVMVKGKDNLAGLIENLEALHPNVILVDKSASRDVLEKVLELGVTVVLDMNLHCLERVARCSGSPILCSDSLFNQELKHCKSFYFENFVEELAVAGEGRKKPSKTLMFVEGFPTRLGCTILLKGSHSEELKKIKRIIQSAVVMAYQIIMETSFLLDQIAMFSTVAFGRGTDILPTDEQSTTVISVASEIPHGEDLSVTASEDKNQVSTSKISGDSGSHVHDSVAADSLHGHNIPVSNVFSNEQLNHVKQTSENFHNKVPQNMDFIVNGSTVSDDLHVQSLSRAVPVATDVLGNASSVPPETDQQLSTLVDLSKRAPDADAASSVPVLLTETPDQHNIEARESFLFDKPCLDHLQTLSKVTDAALDERKLSEDGEDFIQPTDEKSSLVDSESILVLMSSRNALSGAICEESRLSHIKFYGNFDIPLGKYLRDNLFNQSFPCKVCSAPPGAHSYHYAHHNKQLTIHVKRLGDKNHLPGEAEGKLWMWSRCGRCEPDIEKATKRVLISIAGCCVSFGKFLELSFSSHSSSNRQFSCGHSFQNNFLYFFGLGSMVAMFQYSRVATYQVSLPPQKLDFNSSNSEEWFQQEIESVSTKGRLLFTEVSNYLMKIEPQFSTSKLAVNGSLKGSVDIQAMLKVERAEFDENFKNTCIKSENASYSVRKLLSLNRIRWEILLEACVWHRRLQLLLFISNGVVPKILESKEIGDSAVDAKGLRTHVEKAAGNMVLDQGSALLNTEDPEGWAWHLFAEIREECMKDFHKGYLPKLGHLPKFELLHSLDLLPTVSQVIMEEGSRLHIPLSDGDYIVSDYEGEISSCIACALAVTKDLTPPVSDGDDNATLKCTAYEFSPSWLGNSYDPDMLHSVPSMLCPESCFPCFGSLNNLDSLELHPKVTLGCKYSVVVMHGSQFRALREKCCLSEVDYIASLCRCKIWDAEVGKNNSFYAETVDERFLIKELNKPEYDSFMNFGADYFSHMNDSLETGNRTCLAKILGIYRITIRNPKSGKERKHDLMVQENLFFGRNINRQYNLKGTLHRFKPTADGTGEVLLDQNFVNDMNSSPLYISQKSKRFLQRALWTDTSFLVSINVMDYSLLVGVDTQRHELVCGIVDYLRQYTWDKQLETWVKSSLVVPKNVLPTIISPKEYKKRFRKFMDTHLLSIPDYWEPQ